MIKKVLVVMGIITAVGLLVYGLFGMFYYKDCTNDASCFYAHMEKCSHATYVNAQNMTFEYKILGKSGTDCVLNVKLLRSDLRKEDLSALISQSMKCHIPLGVVIVPESDLDNCHGILKEELQNRIVNKLYSYIVQNIGKIEIQL